MSTYSNVVFAGGGNRCFWQAGFWSVAAGELGLAPTGVTAVSAGSAIACAIFSGNFEQGFASYKRAVADNFSNLHLRNLLRAAPLFPHGNLYRAAILGSIDHRALSRLHRGPEIRVLMSCPPTWASTGVAILLGMVVVGVDAVKKNAVHHTVGPRVGFKPLYRSVRECTTPDALADLIVASSCVPPLTPQARRNGRVLLDGGLVSNVPVDGLTAHSGKTLVLLTRQFATLPEITGRTYVQPSKPIPVGAWDYTNDTALQSTFDLGRRDADVFCANFKGQSGQSVPATCLSA